MKTSYFTHKLFPDDGTVIFEPLKKSFDDLIRANNNSAMMDGEYHIVQKVSGDVYTFIKTNSKDVFRKLDTSSNICVDLSNILAANEKIAFASFFIIKNDLIGFSHSLYSPRIGKLASFYDSKLYALNNSHNINFAPLSIGVTPQDILNYAHVGKITMKVEKSNGMIGAMSNLFNARVDLSDIDSFEIIIKPARAKDIKGTFNDVMNNLPQEVKAVAVSAKQLIGDVATDLNVITANTVHDIININGQAGIDVQMEDNYNNNSNLRTLGY